MFSLLLLSPLSMQVLAYYIFRLYCVRIVKVVVSVFDFSFINNKNQ